MVAGEDRHKRSGSQRQLESRGPPATALRRVTENTPRNRQSHYLPSPMQGVTTASGAAVQANSNDHMTIKYIQTDVLCLYCTCLCMNTMYDLSAAGHCHVY